MNTLRKYIASFMALALAGTTNVMAQSQDHYIQTNAESNFYNISYHPNNSTKVIITFDFYDFADVNDDDRGSAIFGAGSADGKGLTDFWLSSDRTAGGYGGKTQLRARTGSKTVTVEWDMEYKKDAPGTRYRATLENGCLSLEQSTDLGKTWKDYKSTSWTADPVFKCSVPMSIGAVYNGESTFWPNKAKIRLYEMVIEENGQILHHFYPAAGENTSRGYLYDAPTDQKPSGSFFADKSISQSSCEHKFVHNNGNGHFKCVLCEKPDIKSNEWAKNHLNSYGMTAIEPFLNVTDLDDNDAPQQSMVLMGMSKLKEVMVIDAQTNDLVAVNDKDFESTNQIFLPNCEKQRELYICAKTTGAENYRDRDKNLTDSITTYAVVSMTQKPFHAPKDVSVSQMPDIQKDGTQKPYNKITWHIEEPFVGKDTFTVNDLMDSDIFMVYRAFQSDFSDEELLTGGTTEIYNYELKKEYDGKGYYTIVDDSPEGQYNPLKRSHGTNNHDVLKQLKDTTILSALEKMAIKEFYKGSSTVYYRLTRAITEGLWGEDAKGFSIRDTLNLHNMLPPVSDIKVVKTNNWSNDKLVNLKVQLKNPYVWEFNTLMDSAKVRNVIPAELAYRRYIWDANTDITIRRYSPEAEYDNEQDMAAEILTIKGKDVRWNAQTGCYEATIQDVQALPYTHYYYTAQLDTTASNYPTSGAVIPLTTTEDEANDCYSRTVAAIGNFTATRGEFNGGVSLNWQMGIETSKFGTSTLRLTRREYKGLNEKTGQMEYGETTIRNLDRTLTEYLDEDALPGHVYEYTLTSIFTFRGAEYVTEVTALGWPSYRGNIRGKVLMPNGTAVAGATVYVRSKDAIDIPDVKDEYGKILMEGVHTGIITAGRPRQAGATDGSMSEPVVKYEYTYEHVLTTNELGEFADTVNFHSDGTQYEVTVVHGTGSFRWNGNTTALLTLSKSKWEYRDVNMVSDVSYRFSGSVTYENSTIPVRNAMFELLHYDENRNVTQREMLRDQNGDYIMTDHRGEFSLCLLPASQSVRVVKEGHTMKNGGFIRINQDTIFKPLQNQDAIDLYDQTRVHMVGRIAGGNVQGNQPLGQGLSRNNLGDNLTVELQLEGDNSSQIVWLEEDPDHTTIKQTFEHPVYDAKGKSMGYKTEVSYERKRIVINPDPVTGEFYVDLAPTKYKVTKLSADGYATFYQSGEGFDVLDYTDSKDTVTYNRIYHKPATVTYTQYSNGRQTYYVGEKKIKSTDMYGWTNEIIVAGDTLNALTKMHAARYAFGYPVVNSESNYMLQVSAHEDYYYNNDTQSGKLDMVQLDGGKLHVRNGLTTDNSEKTYALDADGKVMIYIPVDNPNYTNTGLNARRSVSMQVEYKDYYYEADTLHAFVLGEKEKGVNVLPIANEIMLADIIRDPYGSKSYAWREKGTTYHWAFDSTTGTNTNFNMDIKVGAGSDWYIGVGVAAKTSWAVTGNFNLSASNIRSSNTRKMSLYDMTTSEKICTSADPLDVGAMADVYVGLVNEIGLGENTMVTVIDKKRYDAVRDNVTLVASGKIGQDSCFLVIGDSYRFEVQVGKSDFAYSQKYILGTLIPDLQKKRDALVQDNILESEAQTMADKLHKPQYIRYANGSIKQIIPSEPGTYPNEYILYNDAITQWRELICRNEEAKVNAMTKEENLIKRYSISSNSIDYSQEAESYSQEFTWEAPTKVSWGLGIGPKKGGNGDKPEKQKDDTVKRPGSTGEEVVAAIIFEGNFSFPTNRTASSSRQFYKMSSAGFGFHLDTNDNGYMTVGAYRDIATTTTTTIGNNSVGSVMKSDGKTITYEKDGDMVNGQSADTKIANFIFRLEGGATRQPWYDADTTMVYNPGTSLGNRALKIDNPKIYIDQPVISNQPEDESATFQLRLTNETEIPENAQYLNPTNFILAQVEGTNPDGAKLYIDGAPLGDGRQIYLAPGQTIVKTLEVQKGVGYNFNDIKLRFRDMTATLISDACFSINYLPMASRVSMTSPTDKWVMNTLSDSDEKGFFIPVSLGDFNANSEGFHHIELQYKKQTEGDDRWVTFDSYYDNKELYEQATGVKHMIDNGKITNVKFRGEQDPIEMKYDLRAVTFRQLGTGFVTRTSGVMSGTKDTRCPELFGVAEPTSGILTHEDVIQMNFTEPIAYNYLNKKSNFQIQGYTNQSNIALSSSLQFGGSDDQVARTTVNRNLNQRSFTVDMMVRTAEAGKKMVFFSHGNEYDNMAFGITNDNRLFASISGKISTSAKLSDSKIDITQALTHVGMIFDNETGKVSFFAGGAIITTAQCEPALTGYSANGKISLGCSITGDTETAFRGNMLEVRLWGKKLSGTMISNYNAKRLSGYENQLIAHWPMTETTGNLLKDNAHGANIEFSGDIQWANVDGYSLRADGAPVGLNPELITTTSEADYTITFWFKVDKLDSDSAALFSAGDKHLDAVGKNKLFVGFREGKLAVVTNGKTYDVAERSDVDDHNWHHFAMTVNRSQDQFITYLDGHIANETEACDVDGVASDYVALGDSGMTAHFDVFSRWEQAVPSYLMKQLYNTRFSGREMGLKAYMPFTADKSDQGVMYSDSCVYNCTYSQDDNGIWKQSKQRMVVKGFDSNVNLDKQQHAPIREMPSLENLDFSWSSTGTALQININRSDKEINKQNIFVTVRGIEDEYGNMMQSPQMLTYFVDKNLLMWNEQSVDMACDESHEASTQMTWSNISGKRLSFTIDGLPEWLHASYTQGIADPLEERSLTLRADAGLAAGSYDAVIYITDENGLSDPLSVHVEVKPAECGWSVDKTIFDRTMSLRAIIKTKNCNGNYVLNTDTGNKVGAFIGNTCVGVANIAEDSHLYMTIYGDSRFASEKHNIKFRLWMHETGQIFELDYKPTNKTFGEIPFQTNAVVGLPPAEAVVLCTSDKKIQSLNLTEGWNWVSFNIQPDATEGINSIFINHKGMFSDGDIIKHVDFAQYSEKTLDWMGYLQKTDFRNVFQVYVHNPGTYQIIGYALPEDSLKIHVNPGWNDLPYLLTASTTLDNALGDFMIGDKAQTGDIIKSLDEFAVADGSGEQTKWVGTLKYMQPGVGYYLYHKGDTTSFKYQTNVIAYPMLSKSATRSAARMVDTNMPVIAELAEDIETQPGDTIVAISNGQIVGYTAVTAHAEGLSHSGGVADLLFLSVNAVDGNGITFGLCRDGEVIANTSEPIAYRSDAIVGTLNSPYVISFDDRTPAEDIYDLFGRKMKGENLSRGLYIQGTDKVFKY